MAATWVAVTSLLGCADIAAIAHHLIFAAKLLSRQPAARLSHWAFPLSAIYSCSSEVYKLGDWLLQCFKNCM